VDGVNVVAGGDVVKVSLVDVVVVLRLLLMMLY